MPAGDNPENQEQTDEAPGAARGPDVDTVLTTLNQVFSTLRTQLQDQVPTPFSPAAEVAVATFNDIVADLRFDLGFSPSALVIAARPISLTEVELTWTDDTVNADGYGVNRCQGQSCEDL